MRKFLLTYQSMVDNKLYNVQIHYASKNKLEKKVQKYLRKKRHDDTKTNKKQLVLVHAILIIRILLSL